MSRLPLDMSRAHIEVLNRPVEIDQEVVILAFKPIIQTKNAPTTMSISISS